MVLGISFILDNPGNGGLQNDVFISQLKWKP